MKMAYTANTWKSGDTITATRLNSIENGLAAVGDGKSAYQEWVDAGNTGTEADFLASLKGANGAKGSKGDAGTAGNSIKSLALTADETGKITGGTATLTDDSTVAVTVTTA
jgi:hypothetical protein